MGFNATTDLYVVNNTIVNDRPAGATFVQIAAMVTTPAVLINNIFAGGGTVTNQASALQTASYTGAMPMFLVTNNPNIKKLSDFTEADRIALPGCRALNAARPTTSNAIADGSGTASENDDPLAVLPLSDGSGMELPGATSSDRVNSASIAGDAIRLAVTNAASAIGLPLPSLAAIVTSDGLAAVPPMMSAFCTM